MRGVDRACGDDIGISPELKVAIRRLFPPEREEPRLERSEDVESSKLIPPDGCEEEVVVVVVVELVV